MGAERGRLLRRIIPHAAWAVVAAVLLGGGYFAGRTVAAPPATSEEQEPETYVVVDGSVERTYSYSAEIAWSTNPMPGSSNGGTITSLTMPADGMVDAGDVVLTMNLRPLTIFEGAVPSFRDLSIGVYGEDVRQLRVALGLSDGSDVYDAGTQAAVRTWQAESGYPVTGTVLQSDVAFVPRLPAQLIQAPELFVGATVQAGQSVLEIVTGLPDTQIVLSPEQAGNVTTGTEAAITVSEQEFHGVVESSERTEGELRVHLTATDGGPICDDACASLLAPPGPVVVPVDVVVVPETSGAVVPTSAIASAPDGTAYVVDTDGEHVAVTVVATADGLTVIEGIDVGATILLFAGEG